MIYLGNQAIGVPVYVETPEEAPYNDVNFYDYDGRILYSYTKEQFLALESMPSNPAHEGLTAQGWNWTLSDAKAFVTKMGECDIGQMYTTTDGKTRVFITIPWDDGKANFKVLWTQDKANGVTIDWGDGSATETFSSTGSKNTTHNYTAPGDYVITFLPDNDCNFGLGNTNNGPFTGYGNTEYINGTCVTGVQIGKNYPKMNYRTFTGGYSMVSYVSIPNTCTDFSETGIFTNAPSLKHLTIPAGVTSAGAMFSYCYGLQSVSLPRSLTSVSISASFCYNLRRILISDNATSLPSSFMEAAYSIDHYVIPDGVTSIGSSAFKSCYKLKMLTVPANVTSIGDQAFSTMRGSTAFYFLPTTPPTLGNTNTFNLLAATIYVPYSADHSVLNAYKTADVWSNYASSIVEMDAP